MCDAVDSLAFGRELQSDRGELKFVKQPSGLPASRRFNRTGGN